MCVSVSLRVCVSPCVCLCVCVCVCVCLSVCMHALSLTVLGLKVRVYLCPAFYLGAVDLTFGPHPSYTPITTLTHRVISLTPGWDFYIIDTSKVP